MYDDSWKPFSCTLLQNKDSHATLLRLSTASFPLFDMNAVVKPTCHLLLT
jgi:hypothetical protein